MAELLSQHDVNVVEKDTGTAQPSTRRLSRSQLILRRFARNKLALVGLAVIALLAIIAILGPVISPWQWDEVDNRSFLKRPSSNHLLGTTQAGRDVLALTLHGMRTSLLVGFCVALLSTTIAAVVGSSAAYFGGWVQRVILWVIDLMLVVPSFLLIAIIMTSGEGGIAGTLGLTGNRAWILLVLMLALFAWQLSSRVVRSLSMSVKEQEYVHAARFMGLPSFTVITRHIIPNISSLLIVDATLNVGGAILGETFLSIFGFGIQPPDVSLGTLISDGQTQVTSFPWLFFGPAVVLTVLVMSVNAVGDGLRDAFDPNSQAGGSAK